MCHNVSKIDIISIDNMTQELFIEKYDLSGRPVLVKNATGYWPAMEYFHFEFFRDLYEELQSPVLDNEDPDCQFLSWDFTFENVQVSCFMKSAFLEIFKPNARFIVRDHKNKTL